MNNTLLFCCFGWFLVITLEYNLLTALIKLSDSSKVRRGSSSSIKKFFKTPATIWTSTIFSNSFNFPFSSSFLTARTWAMSPLIRKRPSMCSANKEEREWRFHEIAKKTKWKRERDKYWIRRSKNLSLQEIWQDKIQLVGESDSRDWISKEEGESIVTLKKRKDWLINTWKYKGLS